MSHSVSFPVKEEGQIGDDSAKKEREREKEGRRKWKEKEREHDRRRTRRERDMASDDVMEIER